MKRLIALDLDDTLLGSDIKISPEHQEALRRARAQGCEVTFVTARSWKATAAFVQQLRLTVPVVCTGGATVHTPDGTLLRTTTLDLAEARRLAALADASGWTIRLYFADGRIYASRKAPDFRTRPGVTYPTEAYVGAATPYLDAGEAPVQVVFLGDRSVEGAMAAAETLPHLAPTVYERGSVYSRCHVMHAAVSKGAALAALCQDLGVGREQVIAMGDGLPDRSMIEWAGTGVAMGWAPEAVQAAADLVTRPDDPFPVASALQLLLG